MPPPLGCRPKRIDEGYEWQRTEFQAEATFEDDRGAIDERDAAGCIRLNALRLRTLGERDGG